MWEFLFHHTCRSKSGFFFFNVFVLNFVSNLRWITNSRRVIKPQGNGDGSEALYFLPASIVTLSVSNRLSEFSERGDAGGNAADVPLGKPFQLAVTSAVPGSQHSESCTRIGVIGLPVKLPSPTNSSSLYEPLFWFFFFFFFFKSFLWRFKQSLSIGWHLNTIRHRFAF